jgi:integrase/bifunctional DNA-binding transcriptional regulator/antitoxin component of YhaV-PrlF toxin-antitoxin module
MRAKKTRKYFQIKAGSVSIKVYRASNKGRPSYVVAYYLGPRRQLKTFAKLKKAKAEARTIARNLARGEQEVLHLKSRDRLAYIQALKSLRPTGVPLELAALQFAQAWEHLKGRATPVDAARDYARRHLQELPTKTVAKAVADMLEIKEQEGASEVWLKVLRLYLNRLAAAFQCPLGMLTSSALSEFILKMKGSARTKNNARQVFGVFFKFCRQHGWLHKDHDGISLLSKLRERPGEIQIFTPFEIEQLLRCARTELVPFLALGAFAGLRSAELQRLDWNEIHLTDSFIEVKAQKAKTASRRLVPISENLARWLLPHAEEGGKVVAFANINKQLAWLVADANASLKEAAEAEGKDPEKIQPLKWKKNGLRHSFISYRLAQIQDVNQLALECGNSPAIIFKHYRELVRPAEAETWFAIKPDDDDKVTPLPQPEVELEEAVPR